MASLVAAAYPETFAAVGVHSGLPLGAARSLPEGLAAMRAGTGGTALPAGTPVRMRSKASPPPSAELPVPAIVFHGDNDQTVHPRNGEQVVAAVLRSRVRSANSTDSRPVIEWGVSTQGRRYTRSTHRSDTGQPIAERWLVHGAGHAWSGGHAAGSYTDAPGPDASREMLRSSSNRQARRKAEAPRPSWNALVITWSACSLTKLGSHSTGMSRPPCSTWRGPKSIDSPPASVRCRFMGLTPKRPWPA